MTHDDENVGQQTDDRATPRPRVWPVFVVTAAAILGSLVFSAIALIATGFLMGAFDLERSDLATSSLEGFLITPIGLAVALAGSQLPFLLCAVIPATLSPTPLPERLGLLNAPMAWWTWPAMMLATLAVGNLSELIGSTFMGPPSDALLAISKALYHSTGGAAVVLVMLISVAPGFIEEALFRGYVQRRLLQRYPTWLAILIAATLFAGGHIDPQHALLVLPLGLWLGVLAWWSGSILPAIICHTFNNLVMGLIAVNVEPDTDSYGDWTSDSTTMLIVSSLCLLLTLAAMRRWGRIGRIGQPPNATIATPDGESVTNPDSEVL